MVLTRRVKNLKKVLREFSVRNFSFERTADVGALDGNSREELCKL